MRHLKIKKNINNIQFYSVTNITNVIIFHSPSEFVSFDPLFDSNESSKGLPCTIDKSSIVEPRLLPAAPILEVVVTPVRLKKFNSVSVFAQDNE